MSDRAEELAREIAEKAYDIAVDAYDCPFPETTASTAIEEIAALLRPHLGERPDTIIQGDMFWDADDPEMAEDSPEEILNNDYTFNVIAEFQQATRHSNFFGFKTKRDNPVTDDIEDYRFFASKEEAEAALPEPPKESES